MFRAPALPRTLPAALRDLDSKKADVRVAAARDLVPHVESSRDEVLRGLLTALRDEAPQVRATAAISLADVQGSEALSSLLAAVDDDHLHVRQMAITALGEIGDPRAAGRLRRALSDPQAEVRFQAVIAFAHVASSDAEALEALLSATRDDDPLVCHIALRMAEEIGESKLSRAFLDRAKVLLRHASPTVQVAAALLLAHHGDASGHKVIARVGSGKLHTEDGEDEASAIELCGELRLESAQEGLEKRAFGRGLSLRRERFSWHARLALARMGHERAKGEILRELGSWDLEKRTMAVAAAGRARMSEARPQIEAMLGDPSRAAQSAVEEALALLGSPADEKEPANGQ